MSSLRNTAHFSWFITYDAFIFFAVYRTLTDCFFCLFSGDLSLQASSSSDFILSFDSTQTCQGESSNVQSSISFQCGKTMVKFSNMKTAHTSRIQHFLSGNIEQSLQQMNEEFRCKRSLWVRRWIISCPSNLRCGSNLLHRLHISGSLLTHLCQRKLALFIVRHFRSK